MAIWVCRVLAVLATVLTGVYGRLHEPLTALAFAVFGYGLAVVLLIIYPGEREWVSSVVMSLSGLAVIVIVLRSVGVSV
jgi:hypothetical protein